jgi:hypothetical protein
MSVLFGVHLVRVNRRRCHDHTPGRTYANRSVLRVAERFPVAAGASGGHGANS